MSFRGKLSRRGGSVVSGQLKKRTHLPRTTNQCPSCHSERSEESRPGLWGTESERDSSLRSE
jgi:ribosomal protein L37AE/L43A